jgi:hypothetical protein
LTVGTSFDKLSKEYVKAGKKKAPVKVDEKKKAPVKGVEKKAPVEVDEGSSVAGTRSSKVSTAPFRYSSIF